mgnify:CR=1 FL=1|jgi:hypothetical protein
MTLLFSRLTPITDGESNNEALFIKELIFQLKSQSLIGM